MKRIFTRIHHGLSYLVLAGVVAQFFLAGIGVFGAGSLEAHRMLGGLILLGSLLLILVGLVGRSGRAAVGGALALFLLTILQVVLIVLGDVSRYIAALHPVNALAVLYFSRELAAGRFQAPLPEPAGEPEAVQVSRPSQA